MKPHPRSYRPDLPMTPQIRLVQRREAVGGRRWEFVLVAVATVSLKRWADGQVRLNRLRTTPHECAPYVTDHLTGITTYKAHPRSAFADLPL